MQRKMKVLSGKKKSFQNGEYKIKIRYRSTKSQALLSLDTQGNIVANLLEPVYGVAKGQALVVYQDDCVLGGGVIVGGEK